VLLLGFAVLHHYDPPPVEELRIRTFDTFQLLDPRVKQGNRIWKNRWVQAFLPTSTLR
jgi:hypothetical protein